MFNCKMCGRTTKPGEKPKRVVTKAKEVVHSPGRHPKSRKYPSGSIDPGGVGMQIDEEAVVCASCASVITDITVLSMLNAQEKLENERKANYQAQPLSVKGFISPHKGGRGR